MFDIKDKDLETLERISVINKDVSLKETPSMKGRKSKQTDYLPKLLPEDIMERYDVRCQFIHPQRDKGDEVLKLTLVDIALFCGANSAKKKRGSRLEYVDKIIPKTEIKKINPNRILWGGKQWFVPSCVLEANIDFSKGCISGWIPGENASFDGKIFTDYFLSPLSECQYCYAERQHKNFPKNIYVFDKQRLLQELKGGGILEFGNEKELGRPVNILRFGKRTETWTPFTQEHFITTLETMIETGTKGVVTTKFLPFDKEIAQLLKKTHSSVPYSIGFDELELGACEYGCNNQWRLEQVVKYKKLGVNTFPYLMIIAHKEPTKREKAVIKFAKKNKMPIQLLPLRFHRKNLTLKVTGQTWEFLKGEIKQKSFNFMDENFGSYYKSGNNELSPLIRKMHPFWINLVGNNKGSIRMCHHDDELTYCGGCFSRGEKASISKTVTNSK